MLDPKENQFLDELADMAVYHHNMPAHFYDDYNVKRGLRNKDGTGVVVGLTEIGEVHGYIIEEGDKVPSEGRLRYRGISLKDLVNGFQKEKRFGFEETSYLLVFGVLPTSEQLKTYRSILGKLRKLPDNFAEDMILKLPSKDIMNKLARSVLVSYSFDENPDDISVKNVLEQSISLMARFSTMVAYAYQAKKHYYDNKSLFIHSPQPELSTAENLLYLIRHDKKYLPIEAEILDLSLVIHAEHGGGNNSAFTTHVVSSSDTDTYSTIAAAIGSLKGPKHGGASIKVRKMFENIQQNVKNWSDREEVASYLGKIIEKKAFDKSGLIYGMGHAVYTKSDPRAVLLKEKARELAEVKGKMEEYELLCLVEELTPEVFLNVKKSSKTMCANVDFYSGFVYSLLNIDPELFTPIFAIARIAGWAAHRIEEIACGGRIIRPAYKAISPKSTYVPLEERT